MSWIQSAYGKGVVKYYTSLGKDSSYLNPGTEDSLNVNIQGNQELRNIVLS